MIKCKCGHENEGGSAFCCNCGNRLEILCTSCGKPIAANAKFCSNCGAGTSSTQSKSGTEGNIIAGDVTGSYNTNTSIVNNYYQQATIEKDECCAKCGAPIPAARKSIFQCQKCGRYFCYEHMNTSTHTCDECRLNLRRTSLLSHINMMKTRQYGSALQHFEKEINEGTATDEIYYYAAICLLNGKKAFLQERSTIVKVLNYITNAIQSSPKGIYYYYMAYIKYDFFERKSYGITPNYKEALRMAYLMGVTENEKTEMYALLSVSRPSCL